MDNTASITPYSSRGSKGPEKKENPGRLGTRRLITLIDPSVHISVAEVMTASALYKQSPKPEKGRFRVRKSSSLALAHAANAQSDSPRKRTGPLGAASNLRFVFA